MKHIIRNWILTGLILYELFGFSAVSSAGTWKVGENLMPTRRWGLSTSVVNGKIYAIGGQDDTPQVSKVEEYDTEKDVWTEKKSMPTGRFRHAAAAVGGKIYVLGGTPNNFQALATVEEYDTKADSWTKKADMPTARMGLAAAVVGGKIYAIGGAADFFFPTGAVEAYNPATDTWEKKPDMANPRWNLAAAAVLSKIYVFGGAVDNSHQKATDLVEEYDTKTDTWIPKAKMQRDLHGLGAAFVNSGKIYTIGGQKWKGKGGFQNLAGGPTHWTMYATVAEYDPEKNRWEIKEDMPTPRSTLGVSVVDGKVYAIGGWEGTCCGDRNKVEVYTPDGWPFPKTFSVSPQGKLATIWGAIKQKE